jgi:hypothetical protein
MFVTTKFNNVFKKIYSQFIFYITYYIFFYFQYILFIYLGLPTIVVTVAKNQEVIASNLNEYGYIFLLGDHSDFGNLDKFEVEINKAFKTINICSMSEKALDLVDGFGAERISEILTLNPSTELVARLAGLKDEEFLLKLRNEKESRSNSINTELISPDIHKLWLANQLQNLDNSPFYIIETLFKFPIGQVSFKSQDNYWKISYSLIPLARNKNLSKKMLSICINKLFSSYPGAKICGQIKYNNFVSQKIFVDLGFQLMRSPENPQFLEYLLTSEQWV